MARGHRMVVDRFVDPISEQFFHEEGHRLLPVTNSQSTSPVPEGADLLTPWELWGSLALSAFVTCVAILLLSCVLMIGYSLYHNALFEPPTPIHPLVTTSSQTSQMLYAIGAKGGTTVQHLTFYKNAAPLLLTTPPVPLGSSCPSQPPDSTAKTEKEVAVAMNKAKVFKVRSEASPTEKGLNAINLPPQKTLKVQAPPSPQVQEDNNVFKDPRHPVLVPRDPYLPMVSTPTLPSVDSSAQTNAYSDINIVHKPPKSSASGRRSRSTASHPASRRRKPLLSTRRVLPSRSGSTSDSRSGWRKSKVLKRIRRKGSRSSRSSSRSRSSRSRSSRVRAPKFLPRRAGRPGRSHRSYFGGRRKNGTSNRRGSRGYRYSPRRAAPLRPGQQSTRAPKIYGSQDYDCEYGFYWIYN